MLIFYNNKLYSTLRHRKHSIWNKFTPSEVRLVRVQLLATVKASRVPVISYQKLARVKHGNRDRVGSVVQSFWIEVIFLDSSLPEFGYWSLWELVVYCWDFVDSDHIVIFWFSAMFFDLVLSLVVHFLQNSMTFCWFWKRLKDLIHLLFLESPNTIYDCESLSIA